MPELIRVNTGPLAGHTAAPIDWAKFADFKARCYAAHISYLWGGKDANCGSGEVDFAAGIDCSGFFRTLMMYAAGGPGTGALRDLPDGSYTQGEWLAAQGFKPTTAAAMLLADGHVRVAVHHPNALDEAGHIWIGVNGHSIESWGSHGPGERSLTTMLQSGHRLNDLFSVGYVLL